MSDALDETADEIDRALERASSLADQGEHAAAHALADEALARAIGAFGERSLDAASARIARARIALAAGASTHAIELAAAADSATDPATDRDAASIAIHARLVHAEALGLEGRLDEAARVARSALALADRTLDRDDALRLEALNATGVACKFAGALDEAEAAYREARAMLEARGEEGGELDATLAHNEAGLLHSRGEPERAIAPAWRSVELRRAARGKDDPALAADLAQLGTILLEAGHTAPAATAHRRALWIFLRTHGRVHREVAYGWNELAGIAHEEGRLALAERRYRRAARLREALGGADHPDVAVTLASLAVVQRDRGARREARETIARAYRIARSALGTEHPITRACAKNRAALRD